MGVKKFNRRQQRKQRPVSVISVFSCSSWDHPFNEQNTSHEVNIKLRYSLLVVGCIAQATFMAVCLNKPRFSTS
jgi:hypothetical protein